MNEIIFTDTSKQIHRQPDQPRELPHPPPKPRASERGIRRDVGCGEGASSLPVDCCAGSEHVGPHREDSTGNATVALAANQGKDSQLHDVVQYNVSVRKSRHFVIVMNKELSVS